MTAKTLSVKDMLQNGMTEQDMFTELQKQIETAKEEIAKEEAAKQKVNDAKLAKTRRAAIKACHDHMVALGLIETELTSEEIDEVCESLKEAEDRLAAVLKYANLLHLDEPKKLERGKHATIDMDMDAVDDIISEFLDGLK